MTGHSDQLDDLASALAKAQAELGNAEADAIGHVGSVENGRSYRYATLASVWQAIRKPLSANGLAVIQTCEPSNRGELRLTTTLLHESGQWISGTEIVPMPVQTPQGYGSALTYARRYGLAAMVGVCVDEDDDAVAASERASTVQPSTPAVAPGRPGQRSRAEAAGDNRPARQGPSRRTPSRSWRQLPYNQAGADELRLFARAYAKAKGLETVTSEDIRRDFAVPGKLVEYFGTKTLGDILKQATDPKTVSEEHEQRSAAA